MTVYTKMICALALGIVIAGPIHADNNTERAYFLRAINRNPTDLQSHISYQRVALKMGDRKTLLSEYGAYMRDNPDTGLYLYLYGRLVKNTEHARTYLQRAVKADTTLFNAHIDLGRSYYHDGLFEEAIGRYRVALRLRPKSATTSNLLGLAYYHRGYPQRAIAEYQRAIAHKPDYTDAYLNLGLAFYFTDQPDQAINTYLQGLDGAPPDSEKHLLYHNLGMAYRQTDRANKARDAYIQALKHNPKYIESHISLGNLSFSQGEYPTAIAYYRKAINTESENADLHLRMGLAHFNQQGYDDAITHLKTALKRDSTNVQIYDYLGRAHYLNDQPDQAVQSLETYISCETRYDQKGRVAKAKTLLFTVKRDRITDILK